MSGIESQLGSLHSEVKSYADKTSQRMNELQRQLDAIDTAGVTRPAFMQSKGLDAILKENHSVQRLMRDGKGTAIVKLTGADSRLLERKTVITESTSGSIGSDTGNPVGFASTGVLSVDRSPGIVPEARYALPLRSVLYTRATKNALVDYVKVSSGPAIASPVVEASVKPETGVTFTSASERVRTIAVWVPATKSVLEDIAELRGYLDGALSYSVNRAEELQILSGNGTGENLHGLLAQAASFSTASLGSSWQRLDVVANAVAQIAAAAEVEPTFVVLNSSDWWKLRLTKNTQGNYLLGEPQNAGMPNIWGITIVPTNSIASGSFLAGNGSAASVELVDRMETTVEISTEHSDCFTRNMVAIRAEKRVALVVKRPNAFVTGTFTTSP